MDTLSVTLLDGTATATVTIAITGANDAAQIGGTATRAVTEDADPDNVSGTLSVTDPDTGENHRVPGSLAGQYGSFTFNAVSGEWTYTLDNEDPDTNALPEGAEVEGNESSTRTAPRRLR